MVKRFIKEFLSFARWEQRGFIVLLFLSLSAVMVALFYAPSYEYIPTAGVDQKIRKFDSMTVASERSSNYFPFQNSETLTDRNSPNFKHSNASNPFFFDPNKASYEDFRKLGFSEKQAKALVNYRLKGGRFRSKDDFKRSYVVSDKNYKELEPYLVIKENRDSLQKVYPVKQRPAPVDLNKADTAILQKLPGIGRFTAQKIVEYRSRLGGFCRNEQLLEVAGVDSSRFAVVRPFLLEPSGWTRIKINSVTYEGLRAHPYLTSYEARNIIYYRMKKGRISRLTQLVSERVISSTTCSKLSEYVDCSSAD